ncbi:MAG: helix-turn-helix domain-containing protein [Cellvibrionaceae bacterium]
MIFTPKQAIEAREQVSMSQAKVAREVGLARSYLSEFESNKRVLTDNWQTTLRDYYLSQGWAPSEGGNEEVPVKASLKDNLGYVVSDGFVIAQDVFTRYDVNSLLDEYYENLETLDELKGVELERGFFGGFIRDDMYRKGFRALALAGRQQEIISILHGSFKPHGKKVSLDDEDSICTAGDMLAAVISSVSKEHECI